MRQIRQACCGQVFSPRLCLRPLGLQLGNSPGYLKPKHGPGPVFPFPQQPRPIGGHDQGPATVIMEQPRGKIANVQSWRWLFVFGGHANSPIPAQHHSAYSRTERTQEFLTVELSDPRRTPFKPFHRTDRARSTCGGSHWYRHRSRIAWHHAKGAPPACR